MFSVYRNNLEGVFLWDYVKGCQLDFIIYFFVFRDRPAAIPVHIKCIDDTSNFDDFPEVDLNWRKFYRLSLIVSIALMQHVNFPFLTEAQI